MKKQFSIYKNNAIKLAFAVLLFFVAGMQQVEAQTYNLIPSTATTPTTIAGTNVNLTKTGVNTSTCTGQTSKVGSGSSQGNGTVTANFTGGTAVYTVYIAIDGLDNAPGFGALDRALIAVDGNTITPIATNFLCTGGCSPSVSTYQFTEQCGTGASTLGVSGNYLQNSVASNGGASAKGVYKISSCTPINSVSVTNDMLGSAGGFGLAMYIITGLAQPSLTVAPAF